MRELPQAAREVLQKVRQAHDPSVADVERSLSRLQASLSFGVEPGQPAAQVTQPVAQSTASATPHVSGALFTAKAIKLGLVVIALGGAITAAGSISRAPASRPVKQPVLAAARTSSTAPAVAAAQPSSTNTPAAEPRAVGAAPDLARTAPREKTHPKARHDALHDVRVVSPVQVAEGRATDVALPEKATPSELDLISRAATSLRDGELSRALGLLDEHRALYPAGLLQTEQQGLRVLALCGLGQLEQASRARSAFLRHAGRTPLAARVRRACAESGQP